MNNKFFRGTLPKDIEENKIQEMTIDIKRILSSSFMKSTKDFDVHSCIESINNYIKKHDRLLYSVISNYIFELKNQDPGIFITNLESLTEFVLSDQYSNKYLNNDVETDYANVKKTVLKLWDHVHLALYQFDSLKQSDEEFTRNFIKNIEPVKTDVNKQLNEFTKGMNSQLISLVGIFTAMSFLVFGAINSLDEIFKNAQNIPILQIMIVGSIWGLCVTNLVFVFMFFISKMTDTPIKSSLDKDATLIRKYPLIFWSNLIIVTILSICSWLYYIDTQNIGGWFVNIGKNNSTIVCLLGFVCILAMFITFSMIFIYQYNKKNKVDNKILKNKSIINKQEINCEELQI